MLPIKIYNINYKYIRNKIIKAYKILSGKKICFENRQGFFCNDLMSKTLSFHYRN